MKHDMINNIIFLQDHLISEGVKVEKITKKKLESLSDDELQDLTDKLEAMVDDQEIEIQKQQEEEIQQDNIDEKVESKSSLDFHLDEFLIEINKGVNVEMTIANEKKIFASGQHYFLSKQHADTIIEEKLGFIVSD